jgi:ribosomal protein S18 acetylase RimI-like enzyme
MITTVVFEGGLAWIGNVIVDKQFRGRHIGQSLVQHAVSYLKSIRVNCIGLYCFSNNVGFYDTLGFVKDLEFLRLRREGDLPYPVVRELSEPLTLSRLIEIDRKGFGADRSKLLRALIRTSNGTYFGFSSKRSAAYLMVKKYVDMYDFGPGVGINVSKVELAKLLSVGISCARKRPIELSCFAKNRTILRLLETQGFRTINRGYRMFLNQRARLGNERDNYLLGFLDKG